MNKGLLFILALLPRLYVAFAWPHRPVWDGKYYDIGAHSIAAGLGYASASGNPWCHYPVGYSALLGSLYRLFGDNPGVAAGFNATVGALLAVLTYQLARHALSERQARLAGGLMALYPGMIVYTPLLMTEPSAALLLVAAALAACGGKLRHMLAAGALLGVATLIRPQSLLLAPALALFTPRHTWKQLLQAATIATLTTALVVLPWTWRNCQVMDGCALVSTNSGWNLAIGAFPRATGRFETLRAGDGCHVVTGQVQQNHCWLRLAGGWITADPWRWLSLIPVKWGHTFNHESFAIGYLAEAAPEAWPADRQRRGRGLLSHSYRLLLSLSLLGVLPRASRTQPRTLLGWLGALLLIGWAALTPGQPFWPLALITTGLAAVLAIRATKTPSRAVLGFSSLVLLSLVLIHAVFFGEDRYHMVAIPFLCILAAQVLTSADFSAS